MPRPRSAPQGMSVGMADGRTIDFSIRPRDDAESFKVSLVDPVRRFAFENCPICGGPATTDEHVPPQAIGGRVVTRTCEPCNNRLGTRVESDLLDWVDGAVGRVTFSGEPLPGNRRASRLLLRLTPAGEAVLVIDGSFDGSIGELLDSGAVQLTATQPDGNRMRIGALKQSYLSLCAHLGAIPEGSHRTRAELIAAREATSRESVPYSPTAAGLTILRLDPGSGTPPPEPLIHAVACVDGQRVEGVLMGGRVFVSWSSDPIEEPVAPPLANRMTVTLDVKGKVNGTVASVMPTTTAPEGDR